MGNNMLVTTNLRIQFCYHLDFFIMNDLLDSSDLEGSRTEYVRFWELVFKFLIVLSSVNLYYFSACFQARFFIFLNPSIMQYLSLQEFNINQIQYSSTKYTLEIIMQEKQPIQLFDRYVRQVINLQSSEEQKIKKQFTHQGLRQSFEIVTNQQRYKNQNTIRCKKSNQGYTICINKECKKYAIMCSNKNCECEQDHEQCSFYKLNILIKKLQSKRQAILIQTQQPFSKIQQQCENVIFCINNLKREALKRRETFGLKKSSKILYQQLKARNFEVITGQLLFQVKQQLEQKTSEMVNMQRVKQIFQEQKKQIGKIFDYFKALFDNFSQQQIDQKYKKNFQEKLTIQQKGKSNVQSKLAQDNSVKILIASKKQQVNQSSQEGSQEESDSETSQIQQEKIDESRYKQLVDQQQEHFPVQEELKQYLQNRYFSHVYVPFTFGQKDTIITELIQLSESYSLKKIWLDQTGTPDTIKLFTNAKSSLEHLTIGNYDQDQLVLSKDLYQQFLSLKSLKTFSLNCKKIKKSRYTRFLKFFADEIIRKNIELKIIHSNCYQNFGDSTIFSIAQSLSNSLQHLIIQNMQDSPNDNITGNYIQDFKSLKTLSLQFCTGISKEYFVKIFKNLSNLTHLNICGCKSINSQVMLSIVNGCKSLTYLNVLSCWIQRQQIMLIKTLKHLTVLICGLNRINGSDLIQLTQQIHSIKKLHISYLEVDDKQLLKIYKNSNLAITHLSILGSQQIKGIYLTQMNSLKCLRCRRNQVDNEILQTLKQKQIKLALY